MFMDLVAYMLRLNSEKIFSYDALDPNSFKFVLYASFPKREEAIGIELLEAV